MMLGYNPALEVRSLLNPDELKFTAGIKKSAFAE